MVGGFNVHRRERLCTPFLVRYRTYSVATRIPSGIQYTLQRPCHAYRGDIAGYFEISRCPRFGRCFAAFVPNRGHVRVVTAVCSCVMYLVTCRVLGHGCGGHAAAVRGVIYVMILRGMGVLRPEWPVYIIYIYTAGVVWRCGTRTPGTYV